MIRVVWEFIVRPEAIERFVDAYGPGGAWSRLFEGHAGYLGTTLIRDTANPRRFLTIDEWETESQQAAMLAGGKVDYEALDERLAELCESETKVGVFTTGD